MHSRIALLILLTGFSLSAADFQDFQAARAVIGQPSFSSRDNGVTARALSLGKGNLYVADESGVLLTFDLSRIGAAKTLACPVCLVDAQASTPQTVFQGVAESAVNGNNIVIADTSSRQVMIWRGLSADGKPDVVLSGFVNPVSVALDDRRLYVGDAGTHHVYVWNSLPATNVPPDVTLGNPDSTGILPGADTIESPAALASDGTNLYVADAGAHRVLVFSPGDSAMPQVVNAATLSASAFAPGTLVAVEHGSSTSTVYLNGSPLRLTDGSADQLQFQIPYELNNADAGSLWISTEREDGSAVTSRPVALHFTFASPGIFAFGAKEPRTGMLLHAPEGVPLSPEDPAKPGELLTVWATGLGAVVDEANEQGGFETVLPVHASINGNSVEVLSAALPAEATGVYEVRLRLPAQLPRDASLVIVENDARSNAVTFPVKLD